MAGSSTRSHPRPCRRADDEGAARDERHRRAATAGGRAGQELATLDVLSRGRLTAGVGIGWSEPEFANLGEADRFHSRGAYLDETIRLWRHLWSGATEPFEGRFNHLTDFVFGPLPVQAGGIPILSAADPRPRPASGADRRRLPLLVHLGGQGRRAPGHVRAAAEAAGRMPASRAGSPPFSMRPRRRAECLRAAMGSSEAIAATMPPYAAVGVGHLVLVLRETDPERYVAKAERFMREVVPLVG